MTILWSRTALDHLAAIHSYIGQDSVQYAQRVVDKLIQRAEQLLQFPLIGLVIPEFTDESIRELIEKPYRIIYQIEEDRINILAVSHGARRLQPDLLD